MPEGLAARFFATAALIYPPVPSVPVAVKLSVCPVALKAKPDIVELDSTEKTYWL
jgi:hypothetical protein